VIFEQGLNFLKKMIPGLELMKRVWYNVFNHIFWRILMIELLAPAGSMEALYAAVLALKHQGVSREALQQMIEEVYSDDRDS